MRLKFFATILFVLSATVFVLGCSDDKDSGPKNPGPGKYTDYSERPSKISVGQEISLQEINHENSQADLKYCKNGTSNIDPQVTAGVQVQVLKTSQSSVRTTQFLENWTLGYLNETEFQVDTVLLNSEISDFSGGMASSQPIESQTCKKKNESDNSSVACGNFVFNWTPEYIQYVSSRIPDVDEPVNNCTLSDEASAHGERYYSVQMTTASGIQVNGYRQDSVEFKTLSCPGQPVKKFNLEIQTIYSPDLIDRPTNYSCSGFNKVQQITRIYDENKQLVKTTTEEVLDAPVRISNPL